MTLDGEAIGVSTLRADQVRQADRNGRRSA